MGRPREFDLDEALDTALQLFWRKGYEGTSLTDLTEAMGITRPSLYGAFGNKETLFRKALDRYHGEHLYVTADALREPTSRAVVAKLLTAFCDAVTEPGCPGGCLGLNTSLSCGDEAETIRREQIERHANLQRYLAVRLASAQAEGDLPADCCPIDLARYVMTVAQGIAVQAGSGTTRAELHRIVAILVQAWPGP